MHADWLLPTGLPAQVAAVMTTRAGGVSGGAWTSMNVGLGVGDEAAAVARNRARLADALEATPVFLSQVHGTRVVRIDAQSPQAEPPPQADASVCSEPGVACTVLVADCLPVLFSAPGGRAVAAAHAGWRGLASGVLEATLAALCEVGRCEPVELSVWLGAAIGPRRFEVGLDVLQAFGVDPARADGSAFAARPDRSGMWLADLPRLARERLAAAGVTRVSGGMWCTVEQPSRFFSYRRDRVCGRMAAAICIARR